MKKYTEFIQNFNGEVLRDEPLSGHSSFKIGGPADLMVMAGKPEELVKAIRLSLELEIPFFLLGGGTNIIFHDRGFRGVVIKNLCKNYHVEGTRVSLESGTIITGLAENMAVRGLKGLEALGGLPGTAGGAIVGNAGAYGKSIGDVLEKADLFFLKEREIREVRREFFNFSYRYSILKNNPIAIVLSAALKLEEGDPSSLIDIIEKDRHKRQTDHPTEPSAGCIFKNIEVNEEIKSIMGNKIHLENLIIHNKIPVGTLLDKMGLKGTSVGGATVSGLHGNYIINTGQATCNDVKDLITLIKDKVREDFNIEMKEEVNFIDEHY
jgi:UDP-N-acetylmuramate dehydrogenase